jgi:hypothetical protein
MRTLQEKYNAIQEGKFSKEHFLAEARMQHPQIITRFNGYDDTIQILKNRGFISDVKIEEARLTKNNLTDYRFKPTNEMDKYPYEQILRGIRVELEVAGVFGTPTAEEYAKALAKVSKNLAKDSIFYTNQLAGVNPKVDLHDKMVDATAKNTVDTFNGMKKAELKEGFKKLIKKVLSEEVIDVEDYNGEDEFDMYGDDEADDIPHPRGYEDQDEIDYDDENFSDPFIDGELEEAADTEADKNMVRKLMTMYETEPSKFEKLHKQAQTQASTSKDIKFKHLLSLIDRAKAGALQSLSNQDKRQADSEGMDEIATDITGFPKWRELGQDEKDRIGTFVKDTGDRDQAEYERARKERLAAQSAQLAKHIAGDKNLQEVRKAKSLSELLK